MRYAWDLQHQYLKESGLDRGLKGMLAKAVLRYLRQWDRKTANRVGHYIAISRYIAERIKKAYNREATVIYPPVDVAAFVPGPNKEDFYLTASRMVPYKKMDLIVEAFSRMPDRKLVVIGEGPDFRKVKAKAGGNVELLGYQPPSVMRDYLQRARAFVYAAEEDFGIVTVEAQACGTPVIAFGKGGSLETVIETKTGVFFPEQSVESLINAIREFDKLSVGFDTIAIRKNAEKFGAERFKKEFKDFIDGIMTEKT
jgi:glycosyltransferase involved in cell wall biosynthesis